MEGRDKTAKKKYKKMGGGGGGMRERGCVGVFARDGRKR